MPVGFVCLNILGHLRDSYPVHGKFSVNQLTRFQISRSTSI